MDFRVMKRKDLQTLCKKHGIPANLKNIEMANRLSCLLKNETVKKTTISGVSKDKEAKKVTFSPDTEIFEFTRSLKKRCVTRCSQGPVRESGVEVRRSQRIVGKGKAVVDDSSESEVDEIDNKVGLGKTQKVGRRSTMLITNVVESCVGDGTLLPAKRSKRIVEISSEEDLQDDCKVDKVPRRCRGFLNEVDGQRKTQGRRRSVRLNGNAGNESMGGETSDGGASCSYMETKEERKAKQSKEPVVVNSKTKEHLIDFEFQTTDKVLGVVNVEKVTRRSRRLENNVNVLVEKRPLVGENVEAGKRDGLEVRKATKQSRQLGKSVTELLVDGQARKGDNVKKLDVDHEMQVRVRFTRNSSRHGSYKDPIVIEESVVKKKKEEAFIKSTERVTRSMKRDRSVEPGIGMETTSTQRNLTPVKLLDDFTQFEQEKAGNATEEARGSSKKSKKMIENSSSSSKTKAAEYVMSAANVLDPILEKSVDTVQRTNTQELNSELMGGECEEQLGRDTVLMAAIEKENEEVSPCSMHLTEPLSPASALLAVSNCKADLAVSTGHIFVTDIASTVIVEESIKNKDNSLICSPRPELKEDSTTAKSAKAEAVLENSGECSKKFNSSIDAEKGSSEKDVQAANLHEIFSECNTENSSAKEEMEISKVGLMSVGRSENLTPEKLSDDYAQLEPEEEGGANIEARGSSMKMKTVNQELANDNPRGMAEDSPSISETKATESVENSESVLDSTPKASGGIYTVGDTQESNSKLLEGNHEDKQEQDTVWMTETGKDKEEASSQSVFLTERSEVKSCPGDCTVRGYLSVERTLPPASLQLSVSDHEAELGIVSDHIFVKDIASTVITEGDVKTKEEALVRTPRTELKEHSSVANIANEGVILKNSAECCKEMHSSKDDEKGSPAANSNGNFFKYSNENSSAVEGTEMSKVGCMSVGHCEYLTQEKLLDAYTQLAPEESGGSNVEARDSFMKMKTLNQECIQDEAQGIVQDVPFTSETKATEPILISENVLDSTPELDAEVMEEECEEKQEQDIILMTVTKNEKEEASLLSVSELFVETTSPPAAVQLAVSSPEAEQCVATDHTLLKDVASTVIPEEDIKTKEEIHQCERKEHNSVAKLADAEANLENSAECWNEIQSSKDDEKEIQGNFSEYNTENSGEIEQEEISKVGYVNLEKLDEVKNDSISSERGCKLNVELSGWLSTDFSSVSPMEENTSKYFKETKTKALSQPLARNEDDGTVRESAIFTTPERSLLLLEQLSENGKMPATNSVTYHNLESYAVVFTTPEQQLLLEHSGLNGKMRATDTVDDNMIGKAAEFHDESTVSNNSDRLRFPDSSMKIKTPNQECIHDKAQGMVEDAPFTSETKATEPMMISENVLDSTPKCSGHISPVRNAQEWNAELSQEEREEKQEQDTILMTVTKNDKEEASSLSVPLIELSEVSNPKAELLVETTPPPATIQLSVSSPEAELCMATKHTLLKVIASTVIPEEDITTKEEIYQCELKEHNSVAKLAEVEAILENSAECWNEIQSSKNDEKSPLEKDIQGNFCEYNAENSSDKEQEEISKVGFVNLETLDEVKDDSLEKFERRISSEGVCKLNDELSDWLSTDFSSVSPMEEDKTKALSQPLARNEDDGAVQLAIFTTPEKSLLLMQQLSENGKARVNSVTHHNDEALESHAVVFTTPEQLLLLEDSELDKAGKEEEHTTTDFPDESDAVNSTVRYSLLGGFTQNNARNDGDTLVDNMNGKAAEFHNEPAVSNIPDKLPFPENSELDEAAKSEENKAVELGVDSGIFSGAMKHLQLERDEEMKSATFHDMSDVLTASESQSFMKDFESGEAENKNVESLGESNNFTDLEKHLLSDDSGLNETGKIKDNSAATCEESFVFTYPERRLLLVNSEQQSAETQERKEVELKDGSASFSRIGVGKSDLSQSHYTPSPKVNLMDDSVVQGSRVASLDSKENSIAASGSITSKVSYSHEFNAGQETPGAVFISKGSQAEAIVGLDATEGTIKGSRGGSPLVDSVNLFNLDIEGEETIMGAEMNTSLSSYVLALPTKGYFEAIGETSSHLEVAETCSMVSEESGLSTGIQNQISEALVELEKTEENEAGELIEETSVIKNIQRDSSGGCSFVLAGTKNEHLGSISEVVSEESSGKILEHKAIDPIATPFVSILTENAISPTSDEFTVQISRNEKAADEEKETTPSPEQTSENTKESLNIDESGTLSRKQVRREPILIYGTQMKPKTHDMKENAPNSKIMDNLNVTALRTSKRKPLQDLKKN